MTKKNFILYKGHTGWKIKTRLFGTLLVSLSAVAIAESTGTVDVHAATETPSAEVSSSSAPKTTGTAVIGASSSAAPASEAAAPAAPKTSEAAPESVAPKTSSAAAAPESVAPKASEAAPAPESVAPKASEAAPAPESVAPKASEAAPAPEPVAPKASEATPAPEVAAPKVSEAVPAGQEAGYNQLFYLASMRSVVPESLSLNDAAADTPTDKQYQTLTPGQTVKVGNTDESGVTLSGSQIKDHFIDTVESRSKANLQPNGTLNKVVVPIGDDGSVKLTDKVSHIVYSGSGLKMPTTGHQVAHVSFEHEIDFNHDFNMKGALGIGTVTSGGADSVGIIFAPGDPAKATTGQLGGQLGLGSLDNAFGFVYDDYSNSDLKDPGNGAYFGWRTTDANGTLQGVESADSWKAASDLSLNPRETTPLNDFTTNYVAATQTLSVTIGGATFSRQIKDITTGYSISIAASTGDSYNDYSARIDSFTYTPKTASVDVTVADSTPGDTPVSTKTPVTANIGDTISVFSTKAAAERAVAADPTLDPNLVTVIPASTTSNVYVVDGDQTAKSNGTVHYINDDSSIADGAYYSYKVTGDASQAFSLPISQAFTANVTPVDSVTEDPIPGMDPIQVTTVAGKSVVIQVPGYTPVTVALDAPATGETVANDIVKINTSTTPSTETDVANPIEHYYTATGETMDGTKVTTNATVGTNQSVTDTLNATPIGEDGKAITAGSTPAYTWSTVSNAAATDSTNSTAPQDTKSILVPTKATLDKWLQKATDNQAKADDYQKKTQAIYDKFVGLTGITQEQKDAAKKLLDSVNDMYTDLSTSNATAKAALQAAEDSTDPETIFEKGQAGYSALANMDDTMTTFQNDLDNLTTTNDAAVASLATFVSWSKDYGQDLGYPDVTVGTNFGATLTADQKAGFDNPAFYYYVSATDSDTHVTPKDAGTYYFKLTDAGRTYLKSLTTNTNAGLYTSAALTINPVDAKPTITNTSLQYGGVDGKLAGVKYDLGTVAGDNDPRLNLTQDDFEIDDADGKVAVNQLQVGGKYTIRYSDAAQTALKDDKNYNFDTFGTATLTVTARPVTIAAANVSKTYDDGSTKPVLSLDNNSVKAAMVNGDDVSTLGVRLTRVTGEDAGTYAITGTATANKNYDVTINQGTFIIVPKPITVQANNVAADYDGTPYQVDQLGFAIANGDKLAGTDTPADLKVTLTPTAETNAGTYAIKGSSAAKDYDVTVLDGTLTIAQKAASVNVKDATVGYGDALPTFAVTNSDTGLKTTLDNTDFEIFDNKTNAVATGQLQAGGDYTIRLTQAAQDDLKTSNPNYNLSFGENTLTVTQRAITVHIEDGGKDYGVATDPALTFTIPATTATGEANGTLVAPDTKDNLGVTLTRETGDNAGTYKITGTAATDGNYKVFFENEGAFTIAPIAGTATVADASVVYGNNLPANISVTVNGTASELSSSNFEIVDATKTVVSADRLPAGGKYALQLTATAQDALSKANPNYALKFVAGGLTVTKRPITVKINDVTTTYDGAVHGANGFSIAADDKLANGDSESALGVTLTPISKTDAGTYAITGNAVSANYDVTLEDGTLKIDQADGNVAVTGTNVVYGNSLPSLSVSVNGATASELSADNFEIVDTKTKSVVTADKLQAGGSYTVQLTKTAQDALSKTNSNYKLSFGTDALTVVKKPITVQINNVDTPYDGTVHGANGFSIAATDKLANGDSDAALGVTLNPISETNVGTYAITGKADSTNYDVTLKDGTLKIDQADGNVAVKGTSVTYGDSLPSLLISVNGATASELSADNFEIVNTDTKAVVTADKLQAGGSYTVQLTKTAQDNLSKANGNYNLSFGTDALTVTKKPITVKINDVTATYDGKAHGANGFSIAATDKLANGDSEDALGVTLNSISETNAGTYAITGNANSANYKVTLENGALKIFQVAASVAVGDANSTYDDPSLPQLTATVTGPDVTIEQTDFEIIDNATGKSVVAADLQAGGNYTIQLTQAAKTRLADDNPNYDFTDFGTGTLTVAKRTVTVTVDNQAMNAGDPIPENQSTVVVDGSPVHVQPQLDLSYEEPDGKEVGTYAIGAKSANSNYALTVVPGQLKVLGNVVGPDGSTTITEKDSAGNVVKIDKKWPDGSQTTYVNDPATGNKTVTEQKNGAQVDQQDLTPGSKVTLSDGEGTNTSTVVALDPTTNLPVFEHDTTQTAVDGTITTKDTNGNVVKVVKPWTDDSQTTYTYDPMTGKRTVTDQKDSQTVAEKDLEPKDTQATLSAGDVETIVDAGKPGSQPTFEHNTTATTKDDAGNVTATTKDDAGNVIKVTKNWADGNQTDYTYDPATGKQSVTEQKDGKTVDSKTITPDAPKVTLSTGDGVETTVDVETPGEQPTFKHDTTQTTGDTTTTKDANGNVIKVVKQWPDDSQTTYTYDPATGDQSVTEQKDGKTVDTQSIAPDGKATLASGDNAKTIVNAGQPGSQPTFEHDTTQTTKDAAGNVTATTKDDAGNVIKVTKQWADGSQTDYTYDPVKKTQTVTEQKGGKIVDTKTITPDSPKATLATGDGVETLVDAEKPGAAPTFKHDTTQTNGDTTITKDANGNVIKAIKQWPDDSQTTYTYDPATGDRNVTEQKSGQTVDQQSIAPDGTKATLKTGDDVQTIVNAGEPGSQPTFEHDTTKVTKDDAGNVTATTKDNSGNVIKVVKQWTDGSQTSYTYDPVEKTQSVTEQKDGKVVDQKTFDKGSTKETLTNGGGVEPLVETFVAVLAPGTEPTFTHNTTQTATDKAGNVTDTTKDAAGNVINVTKQWTDGSKTTYAYDPTTGNGTVTEQKDGKTVDTKTITSDTPKATLSAGDGVDTLVDAGQPGSEPTFAHNTTQTTTDKAGNVTATTKDADGNVINVTKQWTDGGKTTYVYDPTTGNRTVTEEKAGKTVDQKTISPDGTTATLSAGEGIDTLVDAGQPGSEPTFEHDTTQTTKDAAGNVTATTKDADGNVVKVTKQWTDGSQTAYTYDPTTGKQTVTEQKDGKTVDQKTITADAPKTTLKSGDGVESTVTVDKPGTEPTFAHNTTQTATDKTGNVTDTTKDATGNVVKVTKHWTDGSQTAYTYDPATGQQTVTEQKDGQTVDRKAIADGKATLKSGDGVESIVTVDKPGAVPTFAHETTRTVTDKAGNVTDTTKDADGNVVKVTKHWTDGSETDYTYDPTTGNRTVTEQKDGKIVDQQTIAPDGTKATLKSSDGVETIVNAGQPGSQPTFAHDTTQTATDKFGNVTATTKDANGNVIKVTKRWIDGSETIYAYNPATGQRTVTEQNDGKLVDRQTIAPDSSKATLASGDGVETIVHTGQPGSQPTFEHETTQTTKDAAGNVTATTKDTDGDIVKVAKQWTDGSETIYAYDPTTGQRTVAEQRDGKTVDQQTIVSGASAVTLSDGAGGTATVKFAQSADAMPTFTHAPASHSTGVSVPTNNDADKKAVKVTKQWPDGIQVIYTYDPMSGQRTVRELKKGKLVAQRTMASGDVDAILPDGMGGTTTVKFDGSETEPIFTRQLADKINSRKVTSRKKTSKKSLKNAGATRNLQKQAGAAKALLNATGYRSAQAVSAGHAGATAVTERRQSRQQTAQQQANQQETELPQTGQKNESFLAQLGVILLALLITPFVRRRSH
ncbi:hypothetical protein FC99_GL000770 [Levilactobacillus koreensis JCM 16448]|nr:MBG domain-containing protein [Levilactobacillus koreensis]KRK87964.1 hypothetical protein FC99_GL000770 [Levilactobacillus koreensis JCM 16448]